MICLLPPAPFGVSGPYSVTVLSGYRISSKWYVPSGHTGQLTEYILRARSVDNTSAVPVEASFPPDTLSGGF